jgi:hypothetical protein
MTTCPLVAITSPTVTQTSDGSLVPGVLLPRDPSGSVSMATVSSGRTT